MIVINSLQDTKSLNQAQIIRGLLMKIVEQGKFSYNPQEGSCKYHNADGSKCAVGMLMDPAFYSPSLEGRPASEVMHYLYGYEKGMVNNSKLTHALGKAQMIHDMFAECSVKQIGSENISDFEKQIIADIAFRHFCNFVKEIDDDTLAYRITPSDHQGDIRPLVMETEWFQDMCNELKLINHDSLVV